MKENLVAPCGINCGVCIAYLFKQHDVNKQGFNRKYCPGCIPRGKHCTHMGHHCELLGKGMVRFCFECKDYPCKKLKALDRRYRKKYHMSMIENLEYVRQHGMDEFLRKEEERWRCTQCGGVVCCHNGLCLECQIETLHRNKKYRWNEA